jgi:hypothetical protein
MTRLFGLKEQYRYDLRSCQTVYADLHFSWKRESIARQEENQTEVREQENERKPGLDTGECEALNQSRTLVWTRHIALLDEYHSYVDVMLRTANGKIMLDEYEEKIWTGADKDINTLIDTIFLKEADAEVDINDYSVEFLVRCDPANKMAYCRDWFFDELLDRLETYHQQQKGAVKEFDAMSGVEFEQWLITAIKQAGLTTVLPTKRTGDQGADVIVQHNNMTIAIQAKCYRHTVGNDAIQQAHAAKTHYRADQGWAITNSRFTPAARRLANTTGVRLVDGSDIHAVGQLIAAALGAR